MRPLIAGNWKMNGLLADGLALVRDLKARAAAQGVGAVDLLVCPPATLLQPLHHELQSSGIALGAQDCHAQASGAHTGEISAAMLADAGCSYVIVGHSERRQNHGEGDEMVSAKASAARGQGMVPIVCVGETEAERTAGQALAVIERQVTGSLPQSGPQSGDPSALVVAYEPVWAIGTGKTASTADVAEAHAHIRALLGEILGEATAAGVRLLYGGSVKPDNAGELLAVPNVNGALVGGASLKAADFWAIATAAP